MNEGEEGKIRNGVFWLSLQADTRFYKLISSFDVLRASLPLQGNDSNDSLQNVDDACTLVRLMHYTLDVT